MVAETTVFLYEVEMNISVEVDRDCAHNIHGHYVIITKQCHQALE